MQRIYLTIFFIIILIFLPSPIKAQENPLQLKVDPRAELVSIIFRLAGNKEYNTGRIKSYIQDVEIHFGGLKNHPAVQYAAYLRETRGVGYNAPMHLAACLTETLDYDRHIPFSCLDGRWRESEVLTFVEKIKQFAVESDFERFFKAICIWLCLLIPLLFFFQFDQFSSLAFYFPSGIIFYLPVMIICDQIKKRLKFAGQLTTPLGKIFRNTKRIGYYGLIYVIVINWLAVDIVNLIF